MFDDDMPKKSVGDFPRNLEALSVEELEYYIQEMEAEIIRAKTDIDKKKASRDAAASIFKS